MLKKKIDAFSHELKTVYFWCKPKTFYRYNDSNKIKNIFRKLVWTKFKYLFIDKTYCNIACLHIALQADLVKKLLSLPWQPPKVKTLHRPDSRSKWNRLRRPRQGPASERREQIGFLSSGRKTNWWNKFLTHLTEAYICVLSWEILTGFSLDKRIVRNMSTVYLYM